MISREAIQKELIKCRKIKTRLTRQLKELPDNTLFTKLEHGKPRLYTYSNGKPLYLSQNSFPVFAEIATGKILRFLLEQLSVNISSLENLSSEYTPLPEMFQLENISPALRDLRYSIKGAVAESSWNDQLLRYLQEEFLPAQQGRITERDIYIWRSIKYEGNPYRPEQKIHQTPGGIYVRSKSELLIATHLEYMDIPYRYEAPLFLEGNIVYPDFTILRPADNKLIYWEHMGMLDDFDYAQKASMKLMQYFQCNIRPYDNLITTYDDNGTIDMAHIEQITNTMLLY